MPSKQPRLAIDAQTSEAFDVRIRTLHSYSEADMPGCIEITPRIRSQTKDYGCMLIILADVSGSMATEDRIQKLRDGVLRLSELSGRFASMRTELAIVEFNDSARLVSRSDAVPPADELRALCDGMRPRGGTNIGAALSMAMRIASDSAGRAVHVALFTDGEDGYGLQSVVGRDEGYLRTMRTHPMLWMHCIGICPDIDCKLLGAISKAARRGTFQYVVEDNIARLMGSLWGFMVEAVDCTCRVSISMQGDCVHRDVVLRVCDPPVPCFVAMPMVRRNTPCITATLTVGTTSKTWMRDLGNRVGSQVDEVCVEHFVAESVAECNRLVAEALGAGDFDGAQKANARALEDLAALAGPIVKAAVGELEAQRGSIDLSRGNEELARELEARSMSRHATACNQGASIDPCSRTLSDLQSQLSQM